MALFKEKGELVTPQTLLSVVDQANSFLLELEAGEYDITAVRVGQPVAITLDAY